VSGKQLSQKPARLRAPAWATKICAQGRKSGIGLPAISGTSIITSHIRTLLLPHQARRCAATGLWWWSCAGHGLAARVSA